MSRFAKLMAMTTSDNDNEALIALRQANKILAEKKMTWREIIAAADSSSKWQLEYEKLRLEYNKLVGKYNETRAVVLRAVFKGRR